MKKLISILLAFVLVFALAACGGEGGEDGGKAAEEVKGAQASWGLISVFVPEGYVLSGGSITGADDTDETQCSIQPETASMYDYYWISVKNKEDIDSSIQTTKEMNSASDITFKTGDIEWTGCSYKYTTALSGDVDIGSVTANIGGVDYLVSFCGHAPESAEMNAVLGSITAAK